MGRQKGRRMQRSRAQCRTASARKPMTPRIWSRMGVVVDFGENAIYCANARRSISRLCGTATL